MSYEAGRDRRLREARGMALDGGLGSAKSKSKLSVREIIGILAPGIFLVVLVLAWALWPSIGEINNEDCNPKGIAAKLSAMIYGDKFWSIQLAGVRDDLFEAENWDRKQAEAQRKIDDIVRQFQPDLDAIQAQVDETYKQYPSLAPTSAEVEAQQLRERADEIEDDEARRLMSDYMRKQVPILRRCEDTIVTRLHKP
jgi:hypothetical protein